jgi:hypothetical protein
MEVDADETPGPSHDAPYPVTAAVREEPAQLGAPILEQELDEAIDEPLGSVLDFEAIPSRTKWSLEPLPHGQ